MKKKIILFIGIVITAVMTFASYSFIEKQRIDKSYSQLAYIRWAGNGNGAGFSQISVFYDKTAGPSRSDLDGIRNKINQKLREDSVLYSEEKKKTWIDAYSTCAPLEIRKDKNTINVNAYLVGGDFFQIHPIKLKNGNYPKNGELQILLDENAAWNLFGSSDLEGMKLWIGDTVFTVSGVVEYGENKLSNDALGNTDTVYIPYESICAKKSLKENEDDDRTNGSFGDSDKEKGMDVKITCYEAVLPNPIKNYGLNTVAEATEIEMLSDEETKRQRSSLNFDGKEIVDNSARFDYISLINRIKERKYADMRTNGIAYPYWENLARFEEKRCINIMLAGVIMLILFVLYLVGQRVKFMRQGA